MIGGFGSKQEAVVIGLMSGTSLDGIDAAIVHIDGSGLTAKAKLLHFHSEPIEAGLRERLKQLCTLEHSDVAAVCGMNAYLGERFAEAALKAIEGAGLKRERIDLVSSHGQTVWHIPEASEDDPYQGKSTLQIGDLSVIAKRTGLPVVGDFRPADMAVGGQGAPLVPYGDLILFKDKVKGRILQNIGGIGNCTALAPDARPKDVFAFDTGPGNMIIDEIVFMLSEGRLTYDDEGRWASQGTPDERLVSECMSHPYFEMEPPKSTGRELFGKAYAVRFAEAAERLGVSRKEDIVASAALFTARSIADSYKRFVVPKVQVDEVIVTGGGARNRTLLNYLARELPGRKILTSKELGFDDDAKEAVIFALLGNDFMHGIANNLPSATGASRPTVMGKLALPW
ncbi:anhydro-N-acetylmuramic acid kinase [Paenibacillus caui]|uniref:anhydro-N-acetylmuramic acid kinase n=1 Tax=Paenibacillus caui TaxID=2873927 RepID=UPI001CA94017|nr:anhydro-N-acetylmuramic acid kinase [Paenibacillus caui]